MYEIESLEDLDNFIVKNNKIILLYFGAVWCGPCKVLKQKLSENETLEQMPELTVCYIDTDKNSEITEMYSIKSLPTQIFIKLVNDNVKELSRIVGYDYTKLLMEYNHHHN
jgi:thiol-disulfide isomerase/thioredoxin